jgi:hypothetical protein
MTNEEQMLREQTADLLEARGVRRFHNGTSDPRQVFVFGSNLLGDHMGGAAKFAYEERGARRCIGQGYTDGFNSVIRSGVHSYALPTMAVIGVPLTLEGVRAAVTLFKVFAYVNEHYEFFVTPVGCGIAGFRHEDIAPMFADAPLNCVLPPEWKDLV